MSFADLLPPHLARPHHFGIGTAVVWREMRRERAGGHPVAPTHREHLQSALDWLARAQDAWPSGGVARGYTAAWNRYFKARGWEPEYPETTGYIIPTLFLAAEHLERPDLAQRAERAARWEIDVQLRSGGVRAGVMGQPPLSSVFNTGQVIFGWLAALEATGDQIFAQAARRAADFLVDRLDPDGIWRRDTSHLADHRATLYNSRTAWALAAAGVRLGEQAYVDAARCALFATQERQRENGWIPDCCLTDPVHPLVHTLAYAIQGLLEGGYLLNEPRLVDGAATAAAALRRGLRDDGWLSGRWSETWTPAADFSCLTGTAQIANVWLRLARVTGDRAWIEPAERALRFLETTQNRTTRLDGLRGGIKGSFPFDGEYGRYETLSWATKFFADAVMRHERLTAGLPEPGAAALA